MRIYGFSSESFVDGPGIRVALFVQGCDNACPHCHNLDSWDIDGGEEYTVREIIKKIKDAIGRTHLGVRPISPSGGGRKALNRQVRGVTFSGGEPFLQARELAIVAEAVKRMGLDITTYTGHTYEELLMRDDEDVKSLLDITDYLIDGPYIHELRDIGLKFRGSSNQRIIDMNETRRLGEVVLFESQA
ncbi:MAG: radical SAM protein [Defluviitaleaceae bacterium]|nr:radical SAM protein [Defluviitaleaceae bacterium]